MAGQFVADFFTPTKAYALLNVETVLPIRTKSMHSVEYGLPRWQYSQCMTTLYQPGRMPYSHYLFRSLIILLYREGNCFFFILDACIERSKVPLDHTLLVV